MIKHKYSILEVESVNRNVNFRKKLVLNLTDKQRFDHLSQHGKYVENDAFIEDIIIKIIWNSNNIVYSESYRMKRKDC